MLRRRPRRRRLPQPRAGACGRRVRRLSDHGSPERGLPALSAAGPPATAPRARGSRRTRRRHRRRVGRADPSGGRTGCGDANGCHGGDSGGANGEAPHAQDAERGAEEGGDDDDVEDQERLVVAAERRDDRPLEPAGHEVDHDIAEGDHERAAAREQSRDELCDPKCHGDREEPGYRGGRPLDRGEPDRLRVVHLRGRLGLHRLKLAAAGSFAA